MKSFFLSVAKFLFVLVLIILALVAGAFAMRMYNTSKYKPADASSDNNAIYLDPTNLENYQTEIEDVSVERIDQDYVQGFHLRPNDKTHPGVIITFGGSEGSPNYEKAVQFSKRGYEVLSLFFFGMPNQQEELILVPLDFFYGVLRYIEQSIPDGDIITLYGGSKGAELCLNLAVRYPEIDNIVLSAPMDYSYMGLSYTTRDLHSSWTWDGAEVPFIDMQKGDLTEVFHMFYAMATMSPLSYRGAYESAYEKDPNREAARIRVEDTQAKILMIAGSDDRMWHSDVAAKNIEAKRPENTEVLIYQGAGHLFYADRNIYMGSLVLAMGGDLETNTQAGIDSDKILFGRLDEWHK
ncbi:MAG: acyl-CoA thioester hydrolase/BAAT C-terminal domain-containing protein [Tissierellia bacterium]|nr:acyl-CoA thioester hydrolase/BAAT C-terminal domain-containing protein [Tissierellia bacterium]